METLANNPTQWRLSTLSSLETEQVHDLARWAVGTLTSFRLILGRCLLAMHQNKGYKKYGCSSAVHYGSSALGVDARLARECKRVARRLLELPRLSLIAERGEMPWGKLREIVRVAVPETEEFWIALAPGYDCKAVQALVSKTPHGKVPGEVDLDNSCTTEFRFSASPQIIEMFKRAQRMFSLEREESLTGAETLECLLASFLSSQPLDPEVLEEVRVEADKDLQAERARRIPEVMAARELAKTMGLLKYSPLGSAENEIAETEAAEQATIEQLLSEALGTAVGLPTVNNDSVECNENCCHSKRHGRVVFEEEAALHHLVDALQSWQNEKLDFNPNSRHTTPAQKKEILRRDGWCCQVPACSGRVWIHIHHIKPYSEGGKTTKANLLSCCAACHRNIHDGHLKITPTADGKLIFTDPNGRRLDQQANLQLAGWLDYWTGWQGDQNNSHQARVYSGDWSVFG